LSYAQFFRSGGVPINAVRAYEQAWQLLQMAGTFRNGREGHEEAEEAPPAGVDSVTGEFTETPTETSTELTGWYDLHPRDGYRELDPDEELPW
jgi:hypothetical protein